MLKKLVAPVILLSFAGQALIVTVGHLYLGHQLPTAIDLFTGAAYHVIAAPEILWPTLGLCVGLTLAALALSGLASRLARAAIAGARWLAALLAGVGLYVGLVGFSFVAYAFAAPALGALIIRGLTLALVIIFVYAGIRFLRSLPHAAH